jgi:hypothetical protein
MNEKQYEVIAYTLGDGRKVIALCQRIYCILIKY